MPNASEIERRTAAEQQRHQGVTAEACAKARHSGSRPASSRPSPRSRPSRSRPRRWLRSCCPAPRPATVVVVPESEPADVDDDQELVPADLTREQALDWRNRPAADHQLVHDHIDRYGGLSAQRLLTRAFVAQVQRLAGLGRMDLGITDETDPDR
ncbi:hypothetical protein [Streptomyces sp. 840.1]|uniref:hypothetical protein n=1 Tax=Streptomyces sp. 840.1 TaxID=2485152 RepID=UPI000F4AC6FB|nr:hypothetical protein [Streptomyces sp. 840.1]